MSRKPNNDGFREGDDANFTSNLASLISNKEIEVKVDYDDAAPSVESGVPSSNVFVPIGIQATMPIRAEAGKSVDGMQGSDVGARGLERSGGNASDIVASDADESRMRAGAARMQCDDGADGNKAQAEAQAGREPGDPSDASGDAADGNDELTVDLADVVDLANVMAISSGAVSGNIPSSIFAVSTDSVSDAGADAVSDVEAGKRDAGKSTASSDASIDPVAARRIAHGLSPVSPFDESASETSDHPKRKSNASSKGADKNASDKDASNKKASAQDKADSDGKADGGSGSNEANANISPQKRRAERFRDKRRVERDKKEKKAKRKRVVKIIIAVLIGLFVASVIALFTALMFIRSGMIDDVQEVKGVWRSTQSGVEISITDDNIVLTDDVAYKYTIDPNAKTISFTFGNLEGSVRYRLSLDGKELSLYDAEVDSSDTFIEDIPWLTENLWALIFNDDLPSAYLGKGSELLERVG